MNRDTGEPAFSASRLLQRQSFCRSADHLSRSIDDLLDTARNTRWESGDAY